MALALYRKYRPRTFAEVIGQEQVTEPLAQALRSGRLHHAYLFSGPRGCGKTSSARILARSMNCLAGPTPEPCGTCESCVALAPDGPGSLDVIEIDAASHGGVDDARDLRERAIFAPVSSRFKVYVIDEAHMVSSAGFNALLKLVEEPPDYVKFVFATTEPEKVLPTIKSRTHHYPFRLVPPGALRPYLEQLCRSEGVSIEPAVFPLVVRAGGGSVRDSLSVLDQLIAGATETGVSYARAVLLLGVTDVALLDEVCDALAAGDGATTFATIDRVVDAGHDPRRFAGDLLQRLRDLIVLQQVPDAAAKGLLDGPEDELGRMSLQAERFGPATVSRLADIVHNGLIDMRGTTAPRLLLELICARMLLPGAEDSAGALLHRLERMERRLTATEPVSAPPTAPAPVSAPPAMPSTSAPAAEARSKPAPPEAGSGPPPAGSARPAPAPSTSASPGVAAPGPAPSPTPPSAPDLPSGPGVVDAAAVRRVWDEVLAYLRRTSAKAAAVVREATVRDVQGDTVVLTFRHTVHAGMLANSPQSLIDAISEVLGGQWQIRTEVAGPMQPTLLADSPASGSAAPAGAHPDGAGAPRPATGVDTSMPAGDDADWPTLARPGGAPVAAAATAGPGEGSAEPPAGQPTRGVANQAAAGTAVPAGRPASRQRAGTIPASAARGADRSGPAATPGRGAARSGQPPSGGGRGQRRPTTTSTTPAYDGFDPDDGPGETEVAGVADRPVVQTTEQRALQLLQQALGAEKISESGG